MSHSKCNHCRDMILAEDYIPNPLLIEPIAGEVIELGWMDSKLPLATQILNAVEQWRGENQDAPAPDLSYETSRFYPKKGRYSQW